MSLQTRLEALVQAIGADIKQLRSDVANAGGGSTPSVWTDQILIDQFNTTSTTPSQVFAGFAPVSNARYLVEAILAIQTAAINTGIRVGLYGPTTGIPAAAVKVVSAANATTDFVSHQALNTISPATAGLTTPTILKLTAILETGGVGAGNIRIQAASEVNNSNVVVRSGSLMRWRKL